MILVGSKLLPEPEVAEAIQLFNEKSFLDPKWLMLCSQHQLTIPEMDWVKYTGTFRIAYATVSTSAGGHTQFLNASGQLANVLDTQGSIV